jgi:DNA mismatch repair protein MutS
MELKEKERTGINSLKIRYNKVFGYYIEVTHTHKDSVPADYIRKQTLANAERFITPQLKEYENRVLGAEERIKNLEYELFSQLRAQCAVQIEPLRLLAQNLAQLDVLGALAQVARENRYVRPKLAEGKILILKESRHPVLEKNLPGDRFIPNDIEMDGDGKRLFLITGPNMAGKSTVMRQAALAVLMAQMGCFVPAKEATVGLVDQLFTRIGASDDLTQGQSTFMVEMLETAHIVRSATEDSFIVMDEIGRGTSTYDGMSIAWAVAEYVAKTIRCRALFATHYHELTELPETVEGIANYQVAVKEWNDEILFLRKLIPGGASRSYGIEVARLAHLPPELLERAKGILVQWEDLEGKALKKIEGKRGEIPQMELFAKLSEGQREILEELEQTPLDRLSPLDALNFLYKIKQRLS